MKSVNILVEHHVFSFQLMQEYDTDFSKTVGTSHGMKKLNRFNNITVCKCSLDYDNNSLVIPITR